MGKRRKTGNKRTNLTPPGNKHYSQRAEQLADSSINSLPPEVLIKILGYLSPAERLTVEAVCKHWKVIAQKSWQSVQKIKISTPYNNEPGSEIYLVLNREAYFTLNTKYSQKVLQKVISLCGCFVRKVHLSGEVGLKTYSLIRNNCSKLTKLKLERFDTYADVKLLSPIFNKSQQLSTLSIDRCDAKMISVLKQLPIESLENLEIREIIEDCSASGIMSLVEKLQTLKNFDFPIYPPLMEAVGMKINLTFPFSLHLNNFNYDEFCGQNLFQMLDLTNLEGLYLPMSGADDDFLIKLAAVCKNLKYLHIGDPSRFTKKGLKAVGTLSNLNFLKVAGMDAVTDKILVRFNKVKRLDCTDCEALTGNGYMSLIKRSKKLEELLISYEEKETEKFLTAAAKFVKTQGRKQVLTIRVLVISESPDDLVIEFNNRSKYLEIYVEEY